MTFRSRLNLLFDYPCTSYLVSDSLTSDFLSHYFFYYLSHTRPGIVTSPFWPYLYSPRDLVLCRSEPVTDMVLLSTSLDPDHWPCRHDSTWYYPFRLTHKVSGSLISVTIFNQWPSKIWYWNFPLESRQLYTNLNTSRVRSCLLYAWT